MIRVSLRARPPTFSRKLASSIFSARLGGGSLAGVVFCPVLPQSEAVCSLCAGHTEPPVPFPQVGSCSSLGQAPTAGSSTPMVPRVAAAAGAT